MDDPKLWIPRKELFSEYQKLKANKLKPCKAEQKQANILHDEELRNLKAARRTAERPILNPHPRVLRKGLPVQRNRGARKKTKNRDDRW